MKKKLLALFTVMVITVAGSVTAFAAPSPSTGNQGGAAEGQNAVVAVEPAKTGAEYKANTTVSEGYAVNAVADTVVAAAVTDIQNKILNDVAAIADQIGSTTLKTAAADATKKITATALSVVDIDKTTATPAADGKYSVTVNNSAIAAGDNIVILHGTGAGAEVIKPDSVAAGKVTFKTGSFSPFTIVRLTVSAVPSAPQTGAQAPMAVVVVAFVALLGAAVCGKKYFA